MCPQNVMMPKIELHPNTMYAFRVAGINSCGIGEFSKLTAFRTLVEGLPAQVENLKFISAPNSLRLCWTPLQEDKLKEYVVFIGEKANGTINFNKIYSGSQPTCTISYEFLKKPEYQIPTNQSKSFLFRIRANNDKGMGPTLQASYFVNSELLV
jgi:host cell factor